MDNIIKKFSTSCKNCDKVILSQLVNSNDKFFYKNKTLRFNDAISYSNLETIEYLKKLIFFILTK